ncbi:Breast cancer type 1 susceptibility protein [Dirofilaria immitis]
MFRSMLLIDLNFDSLIIIGNFAKKMFALSGNQIEREDDFQKIKDQVESIKMILRCGICCSTLRDPIMTTCNHAFCRVCLFECFKRFSLMRCPICNIALNKRSCASCPLLSLLLENYLTLAKAFKKDILANDFAKENDFIESQIAMTQATISPLQLHQNQSRKLIRKESKNSKRRITHLQHKPEKMQRIDAIDNSSSITGIALNTFSGTSAVKNTSCDMESMDRGAKSLCEELWINSEELKSGDKAIQTDEKRMQHKSQQIDLEDNVFSLQYAEQLDFSISTVNGGEISKHSDVNRTDASAQIKATVNSVFQKNKNQSRIEVLIKCIPWISDFLRLSREELIDAVHGANAKKKNYNENSPSKNDIDLVLESDEEMEVAIPINISYADDYLMVSGVSRLSDQSLLREFLDNFSSFKLSTSINRKCTYLIIFNTDGLVCEFWTVKLIYALVNHCTIVSYLWLENCLNQKSILPSDDFEILLKIDETLISVSAQRALTDPSTLFNGYVFYVPQTFFNTQLIARETFLEIIELSGGKTVSHVWELPSACSYIIFAPDCLNQDAARRFEMDVKREVLKADWIFASISQHRLLDRQPYRLINCYGTFFLVVLNIMYIFTHHFCLSLSQIFPNLVIWFYAPFRILFCRLTQTQRRSLLDAREILHVQQQQVHSFGSYSNDVSVL